MRVLWTTAALLIPLSWALAGPGHQQGPPGPPPPLGLAAMHHADDLGLEPSTVAAIETLMHNERPTADTLHDQVRAAHEALRDAMEAEPFDAANAYAASAALGDAEQAARDFHIGLDIAVRAHLTPDAFAELVAMRPAPPEHPRHGRPPLR